MPGRSSGKTSGNSLTTGGIFSIEKRDMDTKLLSAPESNNTLARCIVVGGLSSHRFCIMALSLYSDDNARSCMMQSAFLTQRKASRIPTVLSWSGNISPEGFLSSVPVVVGVIVAVVGLVLR
ncbi:hypothetical protein Tco_0121087 [Tanacetum coccineum]